MTMKLEPEGADLPHQRILNDLHSKHQAILEGFRKVLAENGVYGVDIAKFGLMMKRGAPLCPNGEPANFKCALNANGEYECNWVCD
jgi:hypothetical protein